MAGTLLDIPWGDPGGISRNDPVGGGVIEAVPLLPVVDRVGS